MVWRPVPRAIPPFKHYIGYHGPDGTQVYPNCKPPVEFGGKEKKNILWETPLPFVGCGGPLVVGGRVFVMSEHGVAHGFPELLCLDADTGKILWRREINHLEIAIPVARRRAQGPGALVRDTRTRCRCIGEKKEAK